MSCLPAAFYLLYKNRLLLHAEEDVAEAVNVKKRYYFIVSASNFSYFISCCLAALYSTMDTRTVQTTKFSIGSETAPCTRQSGTSGRSRSC